MTEIKASELRIGNTIKDTDTGFIFDINAFGLLRLSDGRATNFEPILFTEEILVKAGAECIQEGWYGLLRTQNYYKITWNIYDCKIRFMGDALPVKYLHQLQNVIFALTGEELTIENI